MPSNKPPYKTYRARKRPWDRFKRSQFDKLQGGRAPEPGEPDYPAPPPSRSRQDAPLQPTPPSRRERRPAPVPAQRQPAPPPRRAPKVARNVPWLKVGKWFLIWAVSWVVLSGVLFFVSATIQSSSISDATNDALGGGGNLLTSPGNVLVMGLDERPKGSKEPGAGGPARTDSLMILRTGGGEARRLSILRDSYANIPGYSPQKINAAYALGGPSLAIRTVEDFMNAGGGNMEINHMLVVDFERFPALIDALGGVTVEVKQRCIRSTFGGKTFKLNRGEHKLTGEQALRFARVRKNLCDSSEDDRDRAARQQQVMSGMKKKAFSPFIFVRLPWIAWQAPKAFSTDMSPITQAGFILSMTFGSDPKPQVLKPSGAGPGNSLIIPESERANWARRLSD